MTKQADREEKSKRKIKPVVFRPPFPAQETGILVSSLLFLILVTIGYEDGIERLTGDGNPIGAIFSNAICGFIAGFPLSLGSVVFMLWVFWFGKTLKAKVIVSPEGIEYYVKGYSGFAFWHDMEYLNYRMFGKGREWGVVLNRQVDLSENRIRSFFFSLSASELNHLQTFIPLSLSTNAMQPVNQDGSRVWEINIDFFKDTPLGKEIKQYAPHLFEGIDHMKDWS